MFNDNERAEKVYLELKAKHTCLQKDFDAMVEEMVKSLEIPEHIARKIVLSDIVKKNEKQLILYDIFSPAVLKENNI